MKAYFINMHLLVPRSRSSTKVKVKYEGYISQKMVVSGVFMLHKQILFFSAMFCKAAFSTVRFVSFKFCQFLAHLSTVVLMVSYCDRAVFVVRCNFLPCVRSRGHIFSPIFMKLGQNVCLNKISDEFEIGSWGQKLGH